MATNGPIWLLFVFCLTLSFILSGMEAGVFALSRLRVRQQMRAGRASAKVLHGFLEHPENFLWTILVGNTVANFIILGWLINVLQHALNGHWLLFGLLFTLCVFLFYTFFDLLPKMLFRMFPTRLCMLFARPFRLIHLLEVVPGPGDSAVYRGLKLTAQITDERRVRELLVEVVK